MQNTNAWEGTTITFTLTSQGTGTRVDFSQTGYRESPCSGVGVLRWHKSQALHRNGERNSLSRNAGHEQDLIATYPWQRNEAIPQGRRSRDRVHCCLSRCV